MASVCCNFIWDFSDSSLEFRRTRNSMQPKRKRQSTESCVLYVNIPGKKLGKWVYGPGCIGCGAKSAGRYYQFPFAELDKLKLHGITPILTADVVDPWACEACRTRWYRDGIFQTLAPEQEDRQVQVRSTAQAVEGQADEGQVDEEEDDITTPKDHDDLQSIDPIAISEPPKPEDLEPATILDYNRLLQGFVARLIDENLFVDFDKFINQNRRLFELKAQMIGGFNDSHSAIYNDRKKRKVVFAICYEAHIMDRKCDYVKRIVGRELINQSYTTQRYFSRLSICYNPSKEAVIEDICKNNPLLVATIDDFHWCQVRAIPSTANAPGKFTSARTTANYAVKLHRALKRPPAAIGSLNASLLQDLSWIPQVVEGPESESYAKLCKGEILSKKMYACSMATKAASQENFHVIGSEDNPMESAEDLKPVMDNIKAFLSEVGYPDQDLEFQKSFVLAGDFYVWMYVQKLPRLPKYQALQPHVLAVPNLMHVLLNSQEAVLVHAWSLIHPLWVAGYPEVENTTPIKMRPKRVSRCYSILKKYRLRAADNADATPVRKAMIDAIVWVFEEANPLSVDCPYLLASGDLEQIKRCLQRLFPMDDVVPRMVAHLQDLFFTLLSFSFDVKGQVGKLPYPSDLPYYDLAHRPPPQPTQCAAP
ncbi:hypothetical protein DFS34DRAFT_590021 [Phlyctochytrium arcticum]|nr:hypothetical protein DFS34DRAFT_590021 [Phlyctochytrium arcticum]